MINPKPFRTVDEQVAILEARGVLVHDESAAAEFLLRENYSTSTSSCSVSSVVSSGTGRVLSL